MKFEFTSAIASVATFATEFLRMPTVQYGHQQVRVDSISYCVDFWRHDSNPSDWLLTPLGGLNTLGVEALLLRDAPIGPPGVHESWRSASVITANLFLCAAEVKVTSRDLAELFWNLTRLRVDESEIGVVKKNIENCEIKEMKKTLTRLERKSPNQRAGNNRMSLVSTHEKRIEFYAFSFSVPHPPLDCYLFKARFT